MYHTVFCEGAFLLKYNKNAEECDARGDATCSKAGYITKKPGYIQPGYHK